MGMYTMLCVYVCVYVESPSLNDRSFTDKLLITFQSARPYSIWSNFIPVSSPFHFPASSFIGFVSIPPTFWACCCLTLAIPMPETTFYYLSTTSFSHSSGCILNDISSEKPPLTTQSHLLLSPLLSHYSVYFCIAFVPSWGELLYLCIFVCCLLDP